MFLWFSPVNCWPQENGAGGCDVNIEYNLENKEMELNEVTITIPLASGAPPPVVNECEGEHEYDRGHCALVWRIPVIDKTAPSASMDFTARGVPDNFFPVRVSFTSTRLYCDLKVSYLHNQYILWWYKLTVDKGVGLYVLWWCKVSVYIVISLAIYLF